MVDLDELERLEKAATVAPWVTLSYSVGDPRIIVFSEDAQQDVGGTRQEHDAALIVAARNALPHMIERLREAEGLIAAAIVHFDRFEARLAATPENLQRIARALLRLDANAVRAGDVDYASAPLDLKQTYEEMARTVLGIVMSDRRSWWPCARDCGAFVAGDGPTICGSSEIGDVARAESAARAAAAEARWHKTERHVDRFVIRTRGFEVCIENTNPSAFLFVREARRLAVALIAACDEIEARKSPYSDGAKWP